MTIDFSKVSIRLKLLVPIILLLILLFSFREFLLIRNINSRLSEDLEIRLNDSNRLVHNLLEEMFANNLKNYLRGRVEDAFYSFDAVFNAYERGAIPLETALKNLEQGLRNREVGDSGYFFVMDMNGVVIFHPFEENIGQNLSDYNFIREQLEAREGYREYLWQNPGEPELREKAMFTKHLPQMDWLIAITAYREEFSDLLDMDQIRDKILQNNEGTDLNFIVDKGGEIILHPRLTGKNIFDLHEFETLHSIIRDPDLEDGVIDLVVNGEDFRVSYSSITEFQWVILSSFSIEDFYKPVRYVSTTFLLYDLFLILLVCLLIIVLASYVLKPLNTLTTELLQSEMLQDSQISKTGDEVNIARKVFETYADQINQDRKELEVAAEENQLLAEFPTKIKQPVIRINSDMICTFLNEKALNDLDPFQTGQHISSLIGETLSLDLQQQALNDFELQILGKLYKVHVTSIENHLDCYLHFFDLTSEKRLSTLQSVWQHVFKSSIEGITITDEKGIIERINRSFTHITGYEENEIIGKSTSLLKSQKHEETFYTHMWKSLDENGHWEGEIWNRKKTGEIYLEWLSISAFIDNQTGLKKFMAIFHDINDMYEKERELEFMTSHDVLTRLPGRSLFYDRLRQVISSSKRTEESCAIIVLDIYKFNWINEYLGMIAGDAFLIQFSETLIDVLREEDTVARLGGDHFGLILPRMLINNLSLELISRIQESLEKTFVINGKSVKPVINMGISVFPNDGDTVEGLVTKANLALEKSKQLKPGMYYFYDSLIHSELSNRFEFEEALKVALENNEFALHYQPKIDFQTGDLDGFEALIRWVRKDGEIVSPAWFIPKLEENGMIVQVGLWVIKEVCNFVKKMVTVYRRNFKVGINISAKQFVDPMFLDATCRLMSDNNIHPAFVDLEITENIAATEINQAIDMLSKLRKRGFSISIDDFGTGYSSLKYLKDLQFNTLKIDKSFVDPLPGDEESLSIVRSIIDLSKNLEKNIVVEGVETEEQARLFKQLGCHVLQGYYYSKPLKEEDALSLADRLDKDFKPVV